MKKPREFHRQRDLVTGELRKKVVECAEDMRHQRNIVPAIP